jgi:hypothetical protein
MGGGAAAGQRRGGAGGGGGGSGHGGGSGFSALREEAARHGSGKFGCERVSEWGRASVEDRI